MTKRGEKRRKSLGGLAYCGGFTLMGIVMVALFAPWLAPYSPDAVDVTRQLVSPDATYWLGTEENGRDLLSLMIYGARVAMVVGLSTVAICACVGIVLGSVAGYFGGWVDEVIMRVTDILMAFPGILLAILLIFIAKEPGLLAVIGALSVSGWTGYARLVRGQIFSERERDYVEAARALGYPDSRVIFREILPNILGPVIVQATFGVAGAILAEASLSFLGLGPQDTVSWGALLDQGSSYFLLTPHLALFPGLAIMVTVLSINFVGDGLRDWLDPRTVTESHAS